VPIGRFEVPINLLDSPKSFKSFKIRFEPSTIALTNLATFGAAVGATVLVVEVEVQKIDNKHLNMYIEL
jgi:hypothetical protein